jgi:hypothetical protein
MKRTTERSTMKITTLIWLRSMDEVELGTEPKRMLETTDWGTLHSAHPFTVAMFSEPWDEIEMGTEVDYVLEGTA